MNDRKSAVLATAKSNHGSEEDTVFDLPYGVKGRVVAVSARLIDDVLRRIKDPEVPVVFIEDKGREEPNYSDPTYLRAMRDAEAERNAAGMDAMLMFGLQIVGELTTDGWLTNLKMMDKMGRVDLSVYDLNDPMELEYVYKRYIASTAEVFDKIGKVSGISPEEVAKAEATFKSSKTRDTD